jgi:hypothetical protein
VRNQDLEADVRATADVIARLATAVDINESHRANLYARLLRRQRQPSEKSGPFRFRPTWAHGRAFRRRVLLAPPAVAIATALSVFIWSLQIAGHQPTQSAEAARLTQALAQTVPLVTGWSVILHEQRADSSSTIVCEQHGQRLFIRGNKSYLFRDNKWYELESNSNGTISPPSCSFDLQWAFFFLPAQLTTSHSFSIVGALPHNATVEEVRYISHRPGNVSVTVTAWVEKTTGLVSRLDQVIARGDVVIERDSAAYLYTRAQ